MAADIVALWTLLGAIGGRRDTIDEKAIVVVVGRERRRGDRREGQEKVIDTTTAAFERQPRQRQATHLTTGC
jgi:hypothetical protein